MKNCRLWQNENRCCIKNTLGIRYMLCDSVSLHGKCMIFFSRWIGLVFVMESSQTNNREIERERKTNALNLFANVVWSVIVVHVILYVFFHLLMSPFSCFSFISIFFSYIFGRRLQIQFLALGSLGGGESGRSPTDTRRSTGVHALRPAGCLLGRIVGESLCQIVRRLCIFEIWHGGKGAARSDGCRSAKRATEWASVGRRCAEIYTVVGHHGQRECYAYHHVIQIEFNRVHKFAFCIIRKKGPNIDVLASYQIIRIV